MLRNPPVRSGLDVLLLQEFAPLKGLAVGLVTHPAAVDHRLQSAAALLHAAPGVRLERLFGPEHGFAGHAQDLEGVVAGRDPWTGLEIVSLYGDAVESLRPTEEQLRGLDALVIDLVDVGSRYYTFQATMLFCLEEASRRGLLTVVLDRPNPLGGVAVEGPTVRPGFESFVGVRPIATRHGLTIGELARLYRAELGLSGELLVVPCEGWRRGMSFHETGLPWVLPSPNMPTVETALVYPGQCLIEGTNLSEGRGTTRPFELCGAPGVDAVALAGRLNGERLDGVVFRPAWFTPTFQKHAGRLCGGVQLHVTDAEAFRPVRTGLAVLAALREAAGATFAWRTQTYEFVSDIPAIDLLFGSDRERLGLEAGASWRDLARAWEAEEEAFRRERRPHLLYD
jgi:uncharacterized protein YbbC (DUF1343 family)